MSIAKPMHRFYCPQADFTSQKILITDKDELHHLRDVLRLKPNAAVVLFDGKGGEASGTLLTVASKRAEILISSTRQLQKKRPSLILACALPKRTKFEWIIEKATELGVDEILPMKTARTEIDLKGGRSEKKIVRYQTVAINAAKQSQRSMIPKIHPVTQFASAIDQLTQTTQVIIPSLLGNRKNILHAFQELKSPEGISFLIGPEGDFTPQEYAHAAEKGCIPVTLGETTLKVETAAICALSCANLFFRA